VAYKYSNKIDALTVILRRLNNGEQLTASSLAADLCVTTRTIYRYFNHLQAAGYPIYYDNDSKTYKFLNNYKLTKTGSKQPADMPFDISSMAHMHNIAIATFRKSGECLHKNRAMARLMGCSSWNNCCCNFRELASWRDSGLLAMADEVIATKQEIHRDIRLTIDGRERWIQSHLTLVEREKGSYLVLLAQDLTPRMQKEMQVARFFAAMNQAPNLILVTDTTGTIEYVSDRVEELTGYRADELIGKNPRILKSEKTTPETYQNLWSTITKGYPWNGEICNRKKHGDHYWQHLRIAPIFDSKQIICRYVGVIEDISKQKILDDELYLYAVSDLLTKFYSRKMFIELGNREVIMANRHSRPLVLLIIDIDNFKTINDLHGYPVGNQLLQQLAALCRSLVRSTDLLGRIGSDSFGILLTESDSGNAYQIAERIRQHAQHETVQAGGSTISSTVSIGGVALTDPNDDMEQLVSRCEKLLHHNQSTQAINRCIGFEAAPLKEGSHAKSGSCGV